MKNDTSYFGGKSGSGTYQTIINQIPPHTHYIEGFAGMAGIFRKMKSDASCLLIEMDDNLFPVYEKSGFKLIHKLDEYYFPPAKDRTCIRGNAIYLLSKHRHLLNSTSTFLYLDPPYPILSRKSGPKYKYELTDEEHAALLAIIIDYSYSNIAISTYPNRLYTTILGAAGWRMIEFESQTRHGKATEQLWMNYPESKELQDYQYIGSDYRERERITRMQRRWKAKFKCLPELERKAMLQHLKDGADPVAT